LPFLAFFGVKTVALQLVLTLPQQRLHYSPRLLPIPPTYKLNGSSLGRPDVDLIFAKWAFNNIVRGTCACMQEFGYFINFIYISHIQAGIVAGEDVSQRARQRWLATSCGVLVKSSEFLSSPLAIFLSTALSRRRIFLSSSQGTWSSSWRRAARQSPPPPPPPQPSPPTHTQPCPDISFTFFKC